MLILVVTRRNSDELKVIGGKKNIRRRFRKEFLIKKGKGETMHSVAPASSVRISKLPRPFMANAAPTAMPYNKARSYLRVQRPIMLDVLPVIPMSTLPAANVRLDGEAVL